MLRYIVRLPLVVLFVAAVIGLALLHSYSLPVLVVLIVLAVAAGLFAPDAIDY